MPKIPSENTGSSREELMCPHCFSSLEKHPVYAEEFGGRLGLIKATRCTNERDENCPYESRVPPEIMEEVLDEQYESPSLIANIRSKLTTKRLAAMIIGLFLVIALFGNPLSVITSPPQNTLEVEVTTPLGEEYNTDLNFVDYQTGQTVITGNNKLEYTSELGTQEISIEPTDSRLAAEYARIDFSEDKLIESSDGINLTNGTLKIQLERKISVVREGALSSGLVEMTFPNPRNIGDSINVTIEPVGGNQIQNSRLLRPGERTITIPASVISQSATVEAIPTRETVTYQNRYAGEPQQIELEGNILPDEVDFLISQNQTSAGVEMSETTKIDTSGTVNIPIGSEQTSNPAIIRLFGEMQGNQRSISGKGIGTINETIIVGEPSTAKVTIEGTETQRQIQENGTIRENENLTLDIEGDEPVDVQINFTGSEIQNEQIASDRLSARNEEIDQQVTTINENGTYNIKVSEQSNSVDFRSGYYINEDRYYGDQTFNLKEGDTIRLWANAQVEEDETETEDNTDNGFTPPPDYPLVVEDTSVSDTSVSQGDQITVQAKIRNPSDNFYTSQVRLFRNGQSITEKRIELSSGQSRNIIFENIDITKEGENKISINNGEIITVTTGEPSETIIEGQVDINIEKIQNESEITLSSRENTFGCIANPQNDTCNFENVPPGTTQLNVNQKNAVNTQYELNYQSTVGQRNPQLIIEDKVAVQHTGILEDRERITKTVPISKGTNEITLSTEQGTELDYNIQWASSSSIDSPTIDVGNRRVVSSEETTPHQEYTLGIINQSQNNVSISSSSRESFYATIEWTESGESVIPNLRVNNRLTCSKSTIMQNNCTITNINNKNIEIELEDGKVPIGYTLSYIKTETPESATLNINGNEQTIRRQPGIPNWKSTSQVIGLKEGENDIKLQTNPEGQEVTVNLDYTQLFQRPVQPIIIQFRSDETVERFDIPSDKIDVNTGEMIAPYNITIPRGWVSRGDSNILEFSNKNNQGGARIRVRTNISQSGEIKFNERG